MWHAHECAHMEGDIDHEQIRNDAQSEVRDLAEKMVQVAGFDQYTKSYAEDQLGKDWSNIATVYIAGNTPTSDVGDLIEVLEDQDYIATLSREDGQTVVEVKTTYDVTVRFHESGNDDNLGRVVTVEDCDECGGTLRKTSETTQGGGSVASSYEATCVGCDNKQYVAAW